MDVFDIPMLRKVCYSHSRLDEVAFDALSRVQLFLSPSVLTPLFFRLAPHCRCRRILDLEPLPGSAGAVERAEPLRHDARAAQFARDAETDLDRSYRGSADALLTDHHGEREAELTRRY